MFHVKKTPMSQCASSSLTTVKIPEIWLDSLALSPKPCQTLQFRRFTDSVRHQKHNTTGLDTMWTNFVPPFGDCFTSFKKIWKLQEIFWENPEIWKNPEKPHPRSIWCVDMKHPPGAYKEQTFPMGDVSTLGGSRLVKYFEVTTNNPRESPAIQNLLGFLSTV